MACLTEQGLNTIKIDALGFREVSKFVEDKSPMRCCVEAGVGDIMSIVGRVTVL